MTPRGRERDGFVAAKLHYFNTVDGVRLEDLRYWEALGWAGDFALVIVFWGQVCGLVEDDYILGT